MRILVITNDLSTNLLDLTKLSDFADEDEIDIRYGFDSGKEFIKKCIINDAKNDKKHLDFIVVTKKSDNRLDFIDPEDEDNGIEEFAKWIRNLTETYSSDNFQIKSIPIILDDAKTYHKNLFRSTAITSYDLVTNLDSLNENIIIHILGQPINNWLNRLGDELDNADLDTNFIFEKSIIPKRNSFDVKILTQGFFKRLKKLNYVWIGDNIEKLYIDSDTFNKMLKKSKENMNLRNEKEYHKYLRCNTGLFLGDQFKTTIYEHQFYYLNSKKYVEPDFLNMAHSYSFNPHQIFEVKLPNQRLINHKKDNISRYFNNSLNQLGFKYYNYFENCENPVQIKKGLDIDYIPMHFDYKLLIGRQEDKEENKLLINKHITSNKFSLDIIAYDELLSKYQRIFNRVQKFNLK